MLKITRYGYTEKDEERGVNADAILYVPHGAQAEDFAELDTTLWKRIVDASLATEQQIRDLITIESDVYSDKFAEQVAHLVVKICDGMKQVKIKVVEVLVPRAVVDINRSEECAVWELFDHEEHSELAEELRNLHANIMEELIMIFSNQPIVWEIHTMSPKRVNSDQRVTPDTIQDRIDEWSQPKGEKVVTDIICKREGSEEVNVGDPDSVNRLYTFLKRFGVDVTKSERYRLTPNHMSGSWHDEHGVQSSTVIDITKDHTCHENPDSSNFDLRKLTYSAKKLARVAGPYATALANQIGRKEKESFYQSLEATKSSEM